MSRKLSILLVGEFSGFYVNLKEGLKALGHNVLLLANQDGWKKIKGATYRNSAEQYSFLLCRNINTRANIVFYL